MVTMFDRAHAPDSRSDIGDFADYDPDAYRESLEVTPAPVAQEDEGEVFEW